MAAKKKRRRRNARGRGTAWNVVFWISLVVFLVLASAIAYIVYGYVSADRGYQEIADIAFNSQNPEFPADSQDAQAPQGEDDELASLVVDWDYLCSLNPDIVAWVYMPGTRINYPVVQGRDNDEYLHRDFSYEDGFTARGGAVFMDAANSEDFDDDVTYMYGHHMNDGSMFACLSAQLEDAAEFNAHRYVYVLTPDYNYKCETFSLILAKGTEGLVRLNFADYAERLVCLDDIIRRSLVTPSEGKRSPEAIGQVFAFATCDYNQSNGRAVLYTSVVGQVAPHAMTQNGDEKIRSEETFL